MNENNETCGDCWYYDRTETSLSDKNLHSCNKHEMWNRANEKKCNFFNTCSKCNDYINEKPKSLTIDNIVLCNHCYRKFIIIQQILTLLRII